MPSAGIGVAEVGVGVADGWCGGRVGYGGRFDLDGWVRRPGWVHRPEWVPQSGWVRSIHWSAASDHLGASRVSGVAYGSDLWRDQDLIFELHPEV